MPKTLLLADDSVTIQKVVGISFASEDVQLVTVDNGDDAVAKAREVRPDIVLADVVMPGMTGYEVCEAIKQDPQLRHVPVLLLTGTFEAFDEARAREVGADGHVTKPFEAQALVDTVNARLAAAPPPPAPAEAPASEPAAAEAETGPERSFDFFGDDVAESVSPAAPEDSFSLPARPAEEAFAFESEAGASGSDLGLPAASMEDVHPLPADEPEALTTAMLVDDDADDLHARTQVALQPEPAAETRVAFEALDDPDDAPGSDLFDAAPADLPEPAAVASADLFAETNATFAEADAPFEDSGSPFEVGANDPFASASPDQPAVAETRLDPDPSRDYDVSVSDLRAPLAPPPDPDPVDADPGDFAEVAPLREPPPPTVPDFAPPPSPSTVPDFEAPRAVEAAEAPPDPSQPATASPFDEGALRSQLHESLERVAWESFGDLTEQIVSQAVERIEKVAWEVIPQMAEALIREEIRRIKGSEE